MSVTFYSRAWKGLALRPGTRNSQSHTFIFCLAAAYSTYTWKEKEYPGKHVVGGMGQPEDSMSYFCSHPVTWPRNGDICAQEEAENGIWQTTSRICHIDGLDYRPLFPDLLLFHHSCIQNHFKVRKICITLSSQC